MHWQDFLREIEVALAGLAIGFWGYVAFYFWRKRKVSSFPKANVMLVWSSINFILFLAIVGGKRLERLINDEPLDWVAYVALPLIVSSLWLAVYTTKTVKEAGHSKPGV